VALLFTFRDNLLDNIILVRSGENVLESAVGGTDGFTSDAARRSSEDIEALDHINERDCLVLLPLGDHTRLSNDEVFGVIITLEDDFGSLF